MIQLSSLYRYPLKSGMFEPLREIRLDALGLDLIWALPFTLTVTRAPTASRFDFVPTSSNSSQFRFVPTLFFSSAWRSVEADTARSRTPRFQ